MFTPLIVLLAHQQPAIAAGDTWTVERTYRTLNDLPKIDFSSQERTTYTVQSVDAQGFSVLQSRQFLGAKEAGGKELQPSSEAKSTTLKFGPGGAPTYTEDASNLIQAEVDRVQWSAAENRAGISWTRKFNAVGNLGAAKLSIKPTGTTGSSKTVAVTYLEGSIKGEATVVLSVPKLTVVSLKMTLTGITLPGTGQPVKVVVNQKVVTAKG